MTVSRPRKCRNVCCLPKIREFTPADSTAANETVVLTVDEYEAIRLIDKEGISQEECGRFMNVARTTVQQIYTSARKKIADALVNGHILKIYGGDYCLCDGRGPHCNFANCRKRRCRFNENANTKQNESEEK